MYRNSFLKNNLYCLLLCSLATPSLLLFFSNNFKTLSPLVKTVIPIPLILIVLVLRKTRLPSNSNNETLANDKQASLQDILISQQLEDKQKEIEVLRDFLKKKENKTEEQLSYIQNNMLRIQNENHNLKIKLHQTLEDSQKKDIIIKFLKKETKESKETYNQSIEEFKKENENNRIILKEYNTTIQEQREIINQKSSYILKLENKTKDLIFEIRNLLRIEEPDNTSNHNPDSSLQCLTLEKLKIITDKAEKLESVNHLQDSFSCASFLIPASRHSLDCREFFDNLRNETSFILFIYSLKEKNFVFANPMFKKWIGFSPNMFLNKKEEILTGREQNWFKDLDHPERDETFGEILIKTPSKGKINFYYYNRKIQKGPLCQHTIGILTPFEK